MGNSVAEDGLCMLIFPSFCFWDGVFWWLLACFGSNIICEYG
jgi:hypothetical protein